MENSLSWDSLSSGQFILKTVYPGTVYPGTVYPGTVYPGTVYPGTAYPETVYLQDQPNLT